MDKKYTLKQIQTKFKDKYIEVYRYHDWEIGEVMFKVLKKYNSIHENTTLGQDVGTELTYRR